MDNGPFDLIRLLLLLPAIFLASWLAVGLLFAFVAAFWPWLLGALTLGVLFVAAAVHVTN